MFQNFAHNLLLERTASRGEHAAELSVRRRLLALARGQSWAKAAVRGPDGWHFAGAGRDAWERRTREWSPATVVIAMHQLYQRRLAQTIQSPVTEGMDVFDIFGEKIGRVVAPASSREAPRLGTILVRLDSMRRREIELPLELVQDLCAEGIVLNLPKRSLRQQRTTTRADASTSNLKH